MAHVFPPTDADLHALVDGQVSGMRRRDILDRLQGCQQADRLAAWQEQALYLQHSFATVLTEPLPAMLNAGGPIRMPSLLWRRSAPGVLKPATADARNTAGRFAAGAFAALLIAFGLAAAWDVSGFALPQTSPNIVDTTMPTLAAAAPISIEGDASASLPTGQIPDLGFSGFWLSDVDVDRGDTPTLRLHYRNGNADTLTISMAQRLADLPATLEPLTWVRNDHLYAISGSLPAEQLNALADRLRKDPR